MIASIAVVGVAATSIAGIVPARQLFAMRGSDAQVPQVVDPPAVAAAGSLADDGIAAASDSVPDIAAALAAAPAPTVPAPATTPIVGDGRTELGDGLYAIRAGQSVTVHFDVPHARTRRRDKFDRIVRATLPRIYGPVAQAALEDVPTGQLVSVGVLPVELEKSGLRLALGDSASIELWPELRDAQGGPLVVGYRAEATR